MKKRKFPWKRVALSLSIIAYLIIAFLSQDFRFIPFTFFLLFVVAAGIGISNVSDVHFPGGDTSTDYSLLERDEDSYSGNDGDNEITDDEEDSNTGENKE